jgi:hypothetical protein
MLGTSTKCDLSARLAKLDLTILKKQIENHYYSLLDQMRKKMTEVQYDTRSLKARKENVASMSSTGAASVERLAKAIAETTELLHTLHNTDDREIEIIRE